MLTFAAMGLVMLAGTATAGNWNASSASELITAITSANQAGGANTISLAHGVTFTLAAVDNTTDGPAGLPVVAANNNLTIRGNGAVIARSTANGTPAFRLFDVAPGAVLTLQNVTLANGLVIGDPGMNAQGGAILAAAGASLIIQNSTLVANQAVGGDGAGKLGGWGLGGAVWNNGTASFDHTTFSGNQAQGGATTNLNGSSNGKGSVKNSGGQGDGGAIVNTSIGTLTVAGCTFTGNRAIGGLRHKPSAWSDAMGIAGAIENWNTASITDSTFVENQAIGGAADPGVDGGFSGAGALDSGSLNTVTAICTLARSTFNHNQSIGGDAGSPDSVDGEADGGALSNGYTQGAATMRITDCSFLGNEAITGNGGWAGFAGSGALNVESSPSSAAITLTTIANSAFTNNKALGRGVGGQGAGGAISTDDLAFPFDGGAGATLVISNCVFSGNAAIGAPGGESDSIGSPSQGRGGALDLVGNTTILGTIFQNNRAVGGPLSSHPKPSFARNLIWSQCGGGAILSRGGGLEVRGASFLGNQVIAGDGSMGGPIVAAVGGGINLLSGQPAMFVNCTFANNAAVGSPGVGGGLNIGVFPYSASFATAVTLTDTTISYNQAVTTVRGSQGLGGGYAIGSGALFGMPDNSSVAANAGSTVTSNVPDNAFHF